MSSVPAAEPDAAPPTGAADRSVRAQLFGPGQRAVTTGIVLLITLVAFEGMGVGTAMPAVVADLGAVTLYAWPFVAFLAASVFGTVLGGRWCDARGPGPALVGTPLLFGAGLLVAGTAGSMPQLLVGRVLQGAAAGCLTVAVFVLISVVYPRRVQPAVFGLMSSAWVLPALIGPPVAGVVSDVLSWHWVFLGLVPFVAVAVALVVPAVRKLGPPADRSGPERGGPERGGQAGVVVAALGAAVGVSALSWAAQHVSPLAGAVALVAVGLLVPSLRRLLPAGVARARRGVPAVVAARGLLAGSFFTIASYLPLMLHGTHGWSLTAAGVPLISGSLCWSLASAWQGRHPDLGRPTLLRIGFAGLAVGCLGLVFVAPAWGVPWLAVPFTMLCGAGMGLGFSSVSYLVLNQSAAREVGFNTSAAQITDQLTVATMVGLGGALLVLFGTPAAALPVLLMVVTLLPVTGVLVARRTVPAGVG
ncbi:MAG TPA: MFS transporter [Pseudonocardia sp.]|nr:MFS transporter [Pseudonocardia sp.]